MVTITAPSKPWQDRRTESPRPTRWLRRIGGLLTGAWTALCDGGQLGPRADTIISRHAGARI